VGTSYWPITLHSLHAHLAKKLCGRDGRAATILVIVIDILIVVPALWLGATFDKMNVVLERYRDGGISLPTLPEPKQEIVTKAANFPIRIPLVITGYQISIVN